MLKPQRHAIPPVGKRASNAGHQYWDPTLPGALSMSNEQLNTSIWGFFAAGTDLFWWKMVEAMVEAIDQTRNLGASFGDFWVGLRCFMFYSRDIFPWYSHRWWIPLKSPSHSRSPLVCRSQALSRSLRSPRRKPRSEILRFFHINHFWSRMGKYGKNIFLENKIGKTIINHPQ